MVSPLSGPIAGAALSSIEKFLVYDLLRRLPDVAPAMIAIATSVTHCKFEATDAVSDEVVLMKILEVLKACLLCSSGCHLSDEAVCQMMETCFSMCFQMRLSELLRKAAEQTLIIMVQTLFGKLRQIEKDDVVGPQPAEGFSTAAHMDGDISRGKETLAGELPLAAERRMSGISFSDDHVSTGAQEQASSGSYFSHFNSLFSPT